MAQLQPNYLRYLTAIATQPDDEWDGFYHPAVTGSNLEYLFQIAFAGYALTAMQRLVPAWCGPTSPFGASLIALSRRMLQPRVWAYWSQRQSPADPVGQANIMYSGHLSCLLSLTEIVAGTSQFDSAMRWGQGEDITATYDHQGVAAAIHSQMVDAPSHGVACEPGRIYVCCNNHAAISNLLFDSCHPGHQFAQVNAEWSAWVRHQMVLPNWHRLLPGPPGGILSAAHTAPTHTTLPFASNFTDAWGLALMTPYDAELVQQLAPRLWQRLHHDRAGAFLPSMSLLTRFEASDTALNTGFAYLLARELGATSQATQLRAWADQRLGQRSDREHSWLAGEHSALYTTALFSWGDSIDAGDIATMFLHPPRYDITAPQVSCTYYPRVVLSEARWHQETRQMHITVAATNLHNGEIKIDAGTHLQYRDNDPVGATSTLTVTNLPTQPTVSLDYASQTQWDAETGIFTIQLPIGPEHHLVLTC